VAQQEETVRIVVEAVDQATKTLNDVTTGMDNLAKPAKGLTSIMGGLGGAVTTAVGTFAGGAALDLAASAVQNLTGFVTDGIAGAREAAAGYAQLEAVLASTGGTVGLTADELNSLSGELSQAKGMSTFADDQILAAENLLLTFTNVRGDIFKQATGLTADMGTALGTEPQQQAIALGKALNDPMKGITALTRVGVTFTDQQKEQIKVMQQSGDMAGAQAVIIAELNKEFGGSAKAAADAAGPQAQFAEQLGEVSETLGAAILPLIQQFFSLLTDPAVMGAIEGLVNLLVSGFGIVGDVLGDLVDGFKEGGLVGGLTAMFGRLSEMLPVITAAVATWAEAFIAWIGPMIPPFLETLGDLLSALVGWLGEQIPVIVETLAGWAAAFLEWVIPMIGPFLAELGKLLSALLRWMSDNEDEIEAQLIEWANAFADWVMTKGWPLLRDELNKLGDSMNTWMADQAQAILDAALAWGRSVIDGMLQGVQNNWNRLTSWIMDQLRKIPGFNLIFGGGGGGTTGGGTGPFAATTAAAPLPAVGIPVARVGAVSVPAVAAGRGGVTSVVAISVDARGAVDPLAVEQAGYRGARAALEEAARANVGRRSVANLRLALERRAWSG
jgi:hypothetical protein